MLEFNITVSHQVTATENGLAVTGIFGEQAKLRILKLHILKTKSHLNHISTHQRWPELLPYLKHAKMLPKHTINFSVVLFSDSFLLRYPLAVVAHFSFMGSLTDMPGILLCRRIYAQLQ